MPTFWQKLQSIFYPLVIRKSASAINPTLELFYYRGRYILGAGDAIYSDGHQYRPMVAAFSSRQLRPHLASIKHVLVLGTGLGSAVDVLRRLGYHPQFTLVDIDALVLDWAKEFLQTETTDQIATVCADAFDFIEHDAHFYDVVIIDVFQGRKVPEAVKQSSFIAHCKARLMPQGHLVLNYMANDPDEKHTMKDLLDETFTEVSEIVFGINKVYIAK